MSLNANTLKTAIKTRIENELNIDLSAAVPGSLDILLEEIIKHFQENAVIKVTLNQGLNSIFSSGFPVINDGGATLQAAWKLQTQTGDKDKSTGTIE